MFLPDISFKTIVPLQYLRPRLLLSSLFMGGCLWLAFIDETASKIKLKFYCLKQWNNIPIWECALLDVSIQMSDFESYKHWEWCDKWVVLIMKGLRFQFETELTKKGTIICCVLKETRKIRNPKLRKLTLFHWDWHLCVNLNIWVKPVIHHGLNLTLPDTSRSEVCD